MFKVALDGVSGHVGKYTWARQGDPRWACRGPIESVSGEPR
jgi:hypothetical protein